MTLFVQLVGVGGGPGLGYDQRSQLPRPKNARTCMGLASNAFVAFISDVTTGAGRITQIGRRRCCPDRLS